MSLTVKAFLAQDGQWDAEIRRFQIPADVSSSFMYLRKKVCEMFPSLRERNVSLFWKDNDGDAVAFSTDDELIEALGHVTDGIFKLHVASKGASENNRRPRLHPGVICDGCDGPISGPRYKCLVCPNFDLCKTCEKKGLHLEHNKMKIAAPGLPVFPMFPFGPNGPRGFGPRDRGHHGPHGHHFAPPPSFCHWMQRYMNRWHKRNTPERNSSGEETEKTEGEEQTAENMEKEIGEKMEASGVHGESTDSSGEEGIEDPEERMADLMTAVGIDSDDNAEKDDSTETQEKKVKWKHYGHGRKCHGRKMHDHGHWQHGGRDRRLLASMWGPGRHGPYHFGPWALWGAGFGDNCPGVEGPWRRRCCKKGDKKCRMDRASTKERQQNSVSDSDVNKSSKKHCHEKEKHGKRHSIEKSPENEAYTVMVLDEELGPQTNTALPIPRLYPEIPREVPSAPPVTIQHAEALKHLLAMGFNNDGGWLARLVEAKNGNIAQILDAIKPQK